MEKIADYLIDTVIWWKEIETGVQFFDKSSNKSDKLLHHFRSTTIKQECERLQNCWETCLSNPHKIPAFKIKVKTASGYEPLYLTTLQHFKSEVLEMTMESTRESHEERDVLQQSIESTEDRDEFNEFDISIIQQNSEEISNFDTTPELSSNLNHSITQSTSNFTVTQLPINTFHLHLSHIESLKRWNPNLKSSH